MFLIIFCSLFGRTFHNISSSDKSLKSEKLYLSQSSLTLLSKQLPQAFFAADFRVEEGAC